MQEELRSHSWLLATLKEGSVNIAAKTSRLSRLCPVEAGPSEAFLYLMSARKENGCL